MLNNALFYRPSCIKDYFVAYEFILIFVLRVKNDLNKFIIISPTRKITRGSILLNVIGQNIDLLKSGY